MIGVDERFCIAAIGGHWKPMFGILKVSCFVAV